MNIKLPLGYDNFKDIINKKLNIVDKTLWLSNGHGVFIIFHPCLLSCYLIKEPGLLLISRQKWGNILNMERKSLKYLQDWLNSHDRKPLVIRGARQVGKTWLVRRLAELQNKRLVELNFEKKPQLATLFTSNDPHEILLNISANINQTIDSTNSLLFLDEIQAAPTLLAKLRWFLEDLPQLPVIAAGSLLEFTLEEHSFSMPVGRIGFFHLEPLSFEEFLIAKNQNILLEYLFGYDFSREIPVAIHQQFTALFKEYMIVGGMPAAVSSWINERSLQKINQIQHDLLSTYRVDFAKYRGRISIERLDETFMSIPKMLGQKFVFSEVDPSVTASSIKKALSLLEKARVCHAVISSASNGVPLSASVNKKFFKEIFVDIGLCCAALGVNFNQISQLDEIIFINQGGLAEQVSGQLLRTVLPFYIEPALYYWQRTKKGASAEIDYVIEHGGQIVPIEVKAGKTGTLKSLHLFMALKKLPIAIRINSDVPSKFDLSDYSLLSIPFYLAEQVHRLIEIAISGRQTNL